MAIFLVDTCIIADLADPNGDWFDWSTKTLNRLDQLHHLSINSINYAECSILYENIEEW